MTDIRQPRGLACALRDPLEWGAFAGLARDAEAFGYSAVFLPEIAGRDAFAALMGLAGETRDLLLGTGIVPMTSRTLQLTAMAAATVHERSGGRAIVGVGTGPAIPGALQRLRVQVTALHALFGGGTVEIEGRRTSLSLSLDLGAPPPVWISALGPKAVQLAGEIADGVLLNWCTPERVAGAKSAVRDAARSAGRDPDAVTVAVYVRASVGGDPEAAVAALSRAAAEYASYPAYARQFAAMGLSAMVEKAASGDASELARALCLAGDPADARSRLERFLEAGADLAVVYPVAADDRGDGHRRDGRAASIRLTLEALAPAALAPAAPAEAG